MLDVLRQNAKHWAVYFLVGAITVVMVLFFGTSSLDYSDRGWAAKVDGDRIKMSQFVSIYSNRVEYLKKNLGEQFDEKMLKAFKLKENVLESLVLTKILAKESEKNGIYVSGDELKEDIANLPVFQKDGKFDIDYYKMFLVYNNYKANEFEHWRKEEMAREKMRELVSSSLKIDDQDIMTAYKVENERIKVDFFEVTIADDKNLLNTAEIDNFIKTPEGKQQALDYFTKHNDDFKKDGKVQMFENVKNDIARKLLSSKKRNEMIDSIANKALTEKDINAAAKYANAKVSSTDQITRKSFSLNSIPSSSTNDVLWVFSLPKNKIYRRTIGTKTYIVSVIDRSVDSITKDSPRFATFKDKYINELAGTEFVRYVDVLKKKWSGKITFAPSLMREEKD